MTERTAGAAARLRRSRVPTVHSVAVRSAVALTALVTAAACTDVATADPDVAQVVHPSTISVGRAATTTSVRTAAPGRFTEPTCRAFVAVVAASPGGGTVDACEPGWAVALLRTADSTGARVLYRSLGETWTERARHIGEETFAVDELVSLGMPTPVAARFGADKPWLSADNLPAVVRLLGSVPEVHAAIADPCSLLTLFSVDVGSNSFTMTTNDTDQCGMSGGHTLLAVRNGVVTLKIQTPGPGGAADPLATTTYQEALAEFGDSESVDITICGDPVGGDICVTGYAPTPPERRS